MHIPRGAQNLFFAAIALLASSASLFVIIAAAQTHSSAAPGISSAHPELLPPGPEIVNRRTAFSRHFQREEGKYQAWISGAPLHYQDAQGLLQEISAAPEASIDLKPSQYDTYLFSPIPNPKGLQWQAWIGMYQNSWPAHALFQWNLNSSSALPLRVNIDGSSASDVQIRLYLTGAYGTPSTMFIGVYSINSYWTESGADWYYAGSDTLWTTLGGDYDAALMALNSVDNSTGYKSWYSYSVRDDVALERNYWIEPIAHHGEYTNGYLLKTTQETGDYLKYFATRHDPDPAKQPILVINYSDPIPLAHRTPLTRRVPSPDFFTVPSSGLWRAVGLRVADTNANYDLDVYAAADYSDWKGSSHNTGPVDFVVVTLEAPDQPYYPRAAVIGNRTGNYQIEYVERLAGLGTIDPGDIFGPFTLQPENVLSLYSFTGVMNQPGCLMVTPASADALLGVAVFKPGSDPGIHLQGRDLAIASAIAGAPGKTVAVNYRMTGIGTYGVVVWNQGGGNPATFTLRSCSSQYLPLIVK